ncbi:phosphatidylglycerol lysyltransferase domain-containing protein [Frankia sp. AgKG'84/4]
MPRLAALLTFVIGLLDVVSALTPEWRTRLADLRVLLPAAASRQAAAFTVVVGMLLMLLAAGLRRRKRRAWRGVVVLLGVGVVLHVAKGLDYDEAAASAALLGALVLARGEFRAKGDPSTRWRALGVGLLLTAVSIANGFLLLHLREHRIAGPHSWSAQLEQIVLGLVGIPGPLHFTSDRFADLAFRVLLTLGVGTIGTTAYLALRPPCPRPRLTELDQVRVRELLARHGGADSLGYFALRSDKSVIWSPTGKACVAYRVVNGVMLASGDPLGDREAWPGALRVFLREAADHAWTPAVIGCSEAGGTAWTRAGLTALEFGDEAVVDTATFSLDGRAMRNVRQAVARVERAGYTAVASRVRDLDPDAIARVKRQAATWRGAQTERGFSMALGRLGDPADGDCVVVLAYEGAAPGGGTPKAAPLKAEQAKPKQARPKQARPKQAKAGQPVAALPKAVPSEVTPPDAAPPDAAPPDAAPPDAARSMPGRSMPGQSIAAPSIAVPATTVRAGGDAPFPGEAPRLRALLHFVPWGRDGLSLDAMVRDREADNGLNEFLIVSTLRQAADLDVRHLSLNFAFFRSALERGERLGAGPIIRGWRGLLMFMSRWFQIDSLYRFNAKFAPTWQPRFVCYPATSELPRIAVAMLEAEAFLVWPSWRDRLPWPRRSAAGLARRRRGNGCDDRDLAGTDRTRTPGAS